MILNGSKPLHPWSTCSAKSFWNLMHKGLNPTNTLGYICCILTQLLVNTDDVQMNFHSSAENSKLSGEVNGQTFSHLNYFRHMKCLKTLSCSDSVAAGVDFKMSSNKHTHTHTHTHSWANTCQMKTLPKHCFISDRELFYMLELNSI